MKVDLRDVDDMPAAGHWGSTKTVDLLTRAPDWSNGRSDVFRFYFLLSPLSIYRGRSSSCSGKIYVPKSMKKSILEQVHDMSEAGHWGSMKTFDILTRTSDWPKARSDVLRFHALGHSC